MSGGGVADTPFLDSNFNGMQVDNDGRVVLFKKERGTACLDRHAPRIVSHTVPAHIRDVGEKSDEQKFRIHGEMREKKCLAN